MFRLLGLAFTWTAGAVAGIAFSFNLNRSFVRHREEYNDEAIQWFFNWIAALRSQRRRVRRFHRVLLDLQDSPIMD
jgi:hypothetical protein